jgi:tRNA1(Val) A37 N6-methylase TrmN6
MCIPQLFKKVVEYMSIYSLDILTFKQYFESKNKEMYGEVSTDFILVRKILDLLPEHLFSNPHLKWLDPCAGKGYFPIILYKRLFKSLQNKIKAPRKRHRHIIQNMIYMVELNPCHLMDLYNLFGENANIINTDFLEMNNMKFDVIIGNPPFNANGFKKVPTNNKISKKKDGISIWAKFVSNSVENLVIGGYLAMITPSIWMKRDHHFHNYLLDMGEIKLHCMNNTETNRMFHGEAQTPTVFFAFRKCEDRGINIYDSCLQTYVDCESIDSLPLFSPNIIKILNKYVKKVGHIKIIKTSMRPGYKGLSVSTELDKKHPYKNIKTCILNKLDPKLVINYSNKPCSFSGVEKLVLAHKMYGFPYYDKGEYGISNRDNYVIIDTTVELKRIKRFLETDLAFVAYEAARYRMKYLERYAFEFLPDINLLDGFPDDITNESVNDYFKFNGLERMCIKDTRKKRYCTF